MIRRRVDYYGSGLYNMEMICIQEHTSSVMSLLFDKLLYTGMRIFNEMGTSDYTQMP